MIRAVASRLGLLAASLLAVFLILELGLRGLALFHGERELSRPGREGREVVLAVGDSHTYGVYFEAEESYPGQLQRLLEAEAPGRYDVINRGLPGSNSQEIVGQLPDWLLRHRPDAIVLCVGINNSWNLTTAQQVGRPWTQLRTLRLARLLRLAWQEEPSAWQRPELQRELLDEGDVLHRDAETGEVLIQHRRSPQALSVEAATQRLREDLEQVVRLSQERGARLILLTYAASPASWGPGRALVFDAMSDTMVAVAAQRGVEVVDLRPRFAALIRGGASLSDYFAQDGRDTHPNVAGYGEVARILSRTLREGP